MWNFTLSGPPSPKVRHLNLIHNQIQECQIHLDLKNTVMKKLKSRVTKIRGWLQGAEWQQCSWSLYLGHYPYVPRIWTCYAHILLHPVWALSLSNSHLGLGGQWDSYCATHCCFKVTIEQENCKLLKKAFDPCWVDRDEQQHQNNANKFITVNNVTYSKQSNCR